MISPEQLTGAVELTKEQVFEENGTFYSWSQFPKQRSDNPDARLQGFRLVPENEQISKGASIWLFQGKYYGHRYLWKEDHPKGGMVVEPPFPCQPAHPLKD